MTPSAATLRTARRALDMERWDEARAVLQRLLAAEPALAEGWLLLARTEAAAGGAEAARSAFGQCLALAPREPVAWMEYALAEAAWGGGDVVKRARRAGLPQALLAMVGDAAGGRGARARGAGGATRADLAALSSVTKAHTVRDLQAVEARAMPLLRAKPGALVWGLLGQSHLAGGRAEAAAEAFRQGLRLEPYATDLRAGLVRALSNLGEAIAALAEARRWARHAPLSVPAQVAFGRAALAAGLGERALDVAEAALARHPGDDRLLTLAAEAALVAGRAAEATAFAAAREERAAGRLGLLARCYEAENRMDDALAAYNALLAQTPDDAMALIGRGQLRQTQGAAEAAEADLRAAESVAPGLGLAQRALAYGGRLDPGDAVVSRMRGALAGEGLTPTARRAMDYAMARVLQKAGPGAAARHLAAANASMLDSYPYDPRATEPRDLAADWAAFRSALSPGAVSDCAAEPVFVTGLPRSGTTLVEAILSAHPEMAAGGELAVLRRELLPLSRSVAEGRPLTSDVLSAAGEAYVAAARAKLPGAAARWTDKSIQSFLEVGAIRSVLPRARIVYVSRDPRDVGLSIWRNHFRDGTHRYAASQQGIADRIAQARAAMEFWSEALPGSFHELSYEALLADPEGQSRRLLDAAGLGWDSRVLAFHAHAGPVRTLSFDQVRQPLYATSKDGWREAQDEIAELIAALKAKGLLAD